MAGVNTLSLLKSSRGNDRSEGSYSYLSSSKGSESLCASQSPFYLSKLLENLNTQRKNGKFCDVEIICGRTVIKAHKVVLSASSPYFAAMFSGGLKEREQSTIKLHLISGPIFSLLIDFIYTGVINITEQNVQEVLIAADMLQISEVVFLCTKFLRDELHSSNAVGVYLFSDRHHCTELRNAAMHYIESNFPVVSSEEEFFDCPLDQLIKILSSEELRVDSELQVFQAAMAWINHDLKSRRCHVFELLRHVRLPLLSIHVMDDAIQSCDDESLRLALTSIRRDVVNKGGNFVPLYVYPRLSAKKDIYVIGGSKRELVSSWTRTSGSVIYNSVARFDTFKREWSEAAPMKTCRVLPGVTTLGGKIYVVGGEEETQILANGERYEPNKNSWTTISSMLVPRCEFGLCAVNGLLYALGGWVGEDIGDSIERYDPILDQWKAEGYLPEPLFSMGVVAYEGIIYIVGGCTHSKRHLQDLRSFNPVTKKWTVLPPMNVPRSQMGVCILEKHLYVVGGTNKHNEVLHSVEKYSFDNNEWTQVSQMKFGRACPAVTAADGLLYVIGGMETYEVNFWRAQITLSSVECYDPILDVWKEYPSLPSSRGEADAVVL